jgi:hypothetical protein
MVKIVLPKPAPAAPPSAFERDPELPARDRFVAPDEPADEHTAECAAYYLREQSPFDKG